ncbi:hypothetical protein BDN67DRAFT_983752 [Paxillus ammoniavirescens]|nr:hypothetical protein BDN67DRAFT_983752 [Paxillus ammoniavirescens]
MSILSLVLRLAFRDLMDVGMSTLWQNTLAQVPTTIGGALSRFNLHHGTMVYATCPSCSCIHEPTFTPGSATPEYPSHCTNKPKPRLPVCNQPLLQPLPIGDTPVKPYIYHHFHDFVDGQFLRVFKGPLPNTLFVDWKDEGCLVFSMNINFFNVKGVHVHSQTTSCRVISCACLNLPLNIHYKPENMYLVGMILGPNKLHVEEYKNVDSAAEQEGLFTKNGVCWSPLWRLPYWDPARQLVIDTMHCILEGITDFHVHDVLCLTTTVADAPEVLPPTFKHHFSAPDPTMDGLTAKNIKQVKDIHALFTAPIKDFNTEDGGMEEWIKDHIDLVTKRLATKNMNPLKFIADDLCCWPTIKGKIFKVHWVNALAE